MAQIDRIVYTAIDRQTTQITVRDFSIPLLLAAKGDSGQEWRVRTYTDLEAVADDFSTDHSAYKMARALLSGNIRPATFKIGLVDTAPDDPEDVPESYPEALNDVIRQDNTWYVLIADTHDAITQEALATSIQAMTKVYFTSSSDSGILDAASEDDIGFKLKNRNMDRTALIYGLNVNEEFPEAAWVGGQIAELAGSNTWEYKRLNGITGYPLTDSQINTLESKNVNYLVEILGVTTTRRGETAGKSWIDEVKDSLLVA